MSDSYRMILRICFCTLTFVFAGCSYTADLIADHYLFPSDNVRPPTYKVTEVTDVFSTPDGIELVATIYTPNGLEKAPTILVRIPFTKTYGNHLRSQMVARHWARRGYAVVIQGTRGRYGSGGRFYPLFHERTDGIETLKWIAGQPWYDGRLAMWGGSAFGHTQWAVSDQTAPGPNALFVQIASTSFHSMFYPGNAFALESALHWAIRSRGAEDRNVSIDDLVRGSKRLPIIEADDEAVGDTDFFNDWLLKKDDSDYWKQIDGVARTATLQAPALLMAGWFDPFLPTQLEDFKNIKATAKPEVASETRLIIGPWAHAQAVTLPTGYELPYRPESVLPSIPWFDHILGVTGAPFDMPPVKIFVMGENMWRSEREWPLARTKYRALYLRSGGQANTLHGNGLLHTDPCSAKFDYDRYTYDPMNPVPTAGGAMLGERAGIQLQNELEERNDVLVYTTPLLTEDVEVTGPLRAVLYVSTDAPSTDFTVKLVDVFPDGSAYNLSDGILRRDYSEITSEPVRIEIDLWPTSNVFFKGHRIRLEVSSSDFPKYNRNLNTAESFATGTKNSKAQQQIFHTNKYPSQIILPFISSAVSN